MRRAAGAQRIPPIATLAGCHPPYRAIVMPGPPALFAGGTRNPFAFWEKHTDSGFIADEASDAPE